MSSKLKHKRDFIFIDEAGDPGPSGSEFYICSVFHTSDYFIGQIAEYVSLFRFMTDSKHELKSHRLSVNKLIKFNRLLRKKSRYFQCSTVSLRKKDYTGPYLDNLPKHSFNAPLFRKYIYRQALDLHFSKYKPYSKFTELVVDRSDLSKEHMDNLTAYLRRWSIMPGPDELTATDSKYVDMIQVTDMVCAYFIPGNFQVQGFSYSFINHKDISVESALGEKYS